MPIATETQILQMYGSDAGQPVPSLYTKGLSPLCDTCICRPSLIAAYYHVHAMFHTEDGGPGISTQDFSIPYPGI